jgi:hypothetical protein
MSKEREELLADVQSRLQTPTAVVHDLAGLVSKVWDRATEVERQRAASIAGFAFERICKCMVPSLEGAGQHSPACAIFKEPAKAIEQVWDAILEGVTPGSYPQGRSAERAVVAGASAQLPTVSPQPESVEEFRRRLVAEEGAPNPILAVVEELRLEVAALKAALEDTADALEDVLDDKAAHYEERKNLARLLLVAARLSLGDESSSEPTTVEVIPR